MHNWLLINAPFYVSLFMLVWFCKSYRKQGNHQSSNYTSSEIMVMLVFIQCDYCFVGKQSQLLSLLFNLYQPYNLGQQWQIDQPLPCIGYVVVSHMHRYNACRVAIGGTSVLPHRVIISREIEIFQLFKL